MSALTEASEHEIADAIAELEQENRMLRARNERLQRIIDGIVPRLEAACGARTMPPMVAEKFIQEQP